VISGGELRALSVIDGARGLRAIGVEWLGVVAACLLCQLWWHPALYVLAVMFIGARQHALAVIGHDATHHRLLPHRNANDWVGNVLCLWPVFISVEGFRTFHVPHHQHTSVEGDGNRELWHTHEDGELVEDWRYPKSRLGLAVVLLKRGLVATGLWWMLRGLLSSIVVRERPAVIVARYAYFAGVAALVTLAGAWNLFLLYWVVPYCTWHTAIQYMRLICEHSAVHSPSPAYQVTRTTIPTRLESLFVLPRNIGYHIEHHRYPSVPFYRLPELHARLMQLPGYRLNANVSRSVWQALGEVSLTSQLGATKLPTSEEAADEGAGLVAWGVENRTGGAGGGAPRLRASQDVCARSAGIGETTTRRNDSASIPRSLLHDLP
jgi:fatty acid desaturase